MIVLVSGSTATMRRIGNVPNLGVFFNPNSSNYRRQVVPDRMVWAADNAAYTGFNPDKFELMIDTLHHRRIPKCLFVASPDDVTSDFRCGDPSVTRSLFERWEPTITRCGFPVAYVAQDGVKASDLPWGRFSVVFLGGSTRVGNLALRRTLSQATRKHEAARSTLAV